MVEVNPKFHPQHGRESEQQKIAKQLQKNGLKCEIVRSPDPGSRTTIRKYISEYEARQLRYCIGCTKPKDSGLVVCWDCYRSRKDIVPFKYFDGTLVQWLNQEKK